MNVSVAIGQNHSFTLAEALMIYTSDRGPFITHHKVATRPGEAPQLGPATPLTREFVKSLMEGFKLRTTVEILPENVVAATDEMIAWWTPAQKRPMFFADAEKKMVPLSGRVFPHPALLFVVDKGALNVRALGQSKRPQADTPLFVAPYWNVYDDGSVCLGNMRRPDTSGVASIPVWEKGFFGSNFSHANGSQLTTHKQGFSGLWNELADADQQFPTKYLVKSRESLSQYLGTIKE